MSRRLALRKETLAELTTGELTAVVGGAPPTLDVVACTRATLTFCPDFYCTGTI
ncbi:MAG TPA: class I lanthipeptide [Frankiaceae bacterium]|nr:class I lanthipeptide [Frankiaceae bacterium]